MAHIAILLSSPVFFTVSSILHLDLNSVTVREELYLKTWLISSFWLYWSGNNILTPLNGRYMSPDQENNLIQKKAALQAKLQVDNGIKNHFNDWLPIYDYLCKEGVDHELLYLACANQSDLTYWYQAFQSAELARYKFNVGQIFISDTIPEHDRVAEYFPNIHPIRYLPNLPKVFLQGDGPPKMAMQTAVKSLDLMDQPVLFFFQRYSPVLRLRLNDLMSHASSLFFEWGEDAFVVPENFDWMIFCSLENEWHAGYRNVKKWR